MICIKFRICATLGVDEITQNACAGSEEQGGQSPSEDQYLGAGGEKWKESLKSNIFSNQGRSFKAKTKTKNKKQNTYTTEN